MKIIVSSLAMAHVLIRQEQPSHVVSLLSPEEIHLASYDHHPERHLRLAMHDLRGDMAAVGETPPCEAHVENLLSFAAGWTKEAPILVHCWAGISRSTAAAFTIACVRNPDTDEAEIAKAVRAASPTAWPNPLIVGLADAALGRGGRMLAAIESIGAPESFDGARPFVIPADFSARKG